MGLHEILSPRARTLKVLDFTVSFNEFPDLPLPLRLCDELEAMARHNILEALSFEVDVDSDGYKTEKLIGSKIQNAVKVPVKLGWSAFVTTGSFKDSIAWRTAKSCPRRRYSLYPINILVTLKSMLSIFRLPLSSEY